MRKKFSTITEREVAADLAAELDKMIQQGGTPFWPSDTTLSPKMGS
jgi:hypothetical protein